MKEITDRLIEFRTLREWETYHRPENLAKALVIESGEVLELFLWGNALTLEDIKKLKHELADVGIYLLYLCEKYNIDLKQAIMEKIDINEQKYPVNKSKGNCKKYTAFFKSEDLA